MCEVFRLVELNGIDEDADHHGLALRACLADQLQMAFMESAHRRNQPDVPAALTAQRKALAQGIDCTYDHVPDFTSSMYSLAARAISVRSCAYCFTNEGGFSYSPSMS